MNIEQAMQEFWDEYPDTEGWGTKTEIIFSDFDAQSDDLTPRPENKAHFLVAIHGIKNGKNMATGFGISTILDVAQTEALTDLLKKLPKPPEGSIRVKTRRY